MKFQNIVFIYLRGIIPIKLDLPIFNGVDMYIFKRFFKKVNTKMFVEEPWLVPTPGL